MRACKIALLIALFVFIPLMAGAAEQNDFEVKTTQDLIDLCTVTPDDPLFAEAVNFCHGFLVGAYQYYEASIAGPKGHPLVCIPDPKPTRSEAIGMFIQWAQNNPQYMGEPPVESEFRFLMEKWPCKH